jgi:hypothetical protein
MCLQQTRNITVPEDGGSMFLRNFGVHVQLYTALGPRRSYAHYHYRENFRCHRDKMLLLINFSLSF